MSRSVPVLMIVFNRPDKTRQVFDAVRRARPSQLFVAADGPRPDRPGEAERCQQTREIFGEVDWPCQIHRLFRDSNLGCKGGPESAITWFFSEVEQGIVLEDDCVPTSSFFDFCGALLERYRDVDDVMMVSGTNPLDEWPRPGMNTYHFTQMYETWGWATWRRAWRHYDPMMRRWSEPSVRNHIRAVLGDEEFSKAQKDFDDVASGLLDAWDFAWAFAMLDAGGMTAMPSRNLVTNIGFDQEATHTKNQWSHRAERTGYELQFPLVHADEVVPDRAFEREARRRDDSMRSRIAMALPSFVEAPLRSAYHRLTALLPRLAQGSTRS